MDIKGRKLWQHAAGDNNRNYADLCLEWDVIVSGWGKHGHWNNEGKNKLLEKKKTKHISASKITDIETFANRISSGDIVVLRIGTTRILGVGEVVGNYEWCPSFGDVDGWDLQHVRRVRWLWKKGDLPSLDWSGSKLSWGATTRALTNQFVISWIRDKLDFDGQGLTRDVCKLPSVEDSRISIEDLSGFLFVALIFIFNYLYKYKHLLKVFFLFFEVW